MLHKKAHFHKPISHKGNDSDRLCADGARPALPRSASRLLSTVFVSAGAVLNSTMPLILILVIVLLVVGGGGYYMGPGVGYYGGGTLDIIIGLIIIYLLFGRGRTRL